MYSWIDECITGLFDLCEATYIHDIYDYLDIKIVKLHKDNILLNGSEAIYHRNFMGDEIVYIRDDLDYKYEVFILAHELGHAILHIEIFEAAFNKNLLNKGKFERQANYFALKLLDTEIDPVWYEGATVKQVACALHITEDSLLYNQEKEGWNNNMGKNITFQNEETEQYFYRIAREYGLMHVNFADDTVITMETVEKLIKSLSSLK